MLELSKDKRRLKNAELLKKSDLWVCGDGVSFPHTDDGLNNARKWARKNNISINLERKTKVVAKPRSEKPGNKKIKTKK